MLRAWLEATEPTKTRVSEDVSSDEPARSTIVIEVSSQVMHHSLCSFHMYSKLTVFFIHGCLAKDRI